MKLLNILIVDDEIEITEIVALLVGVHYDADFSFAHSGKAATNLIANTKIPFDLVISDFNMPNGNGKFVFEFIQQNKLNIPFLLLTSDNWSEHPEMNKKPKTTYVQKPFDEDHLIEVIAKALELESNNQNTYVGISLNTLLKIKIMTSALYLRLSEHKFIKVINEGHLFEETDFNKYKLKNISSLFVAKEHFSRLVQDFKTRVLNDLFFNSFKSDAQEEFLISASVNEIINSSVISFGFSDQAIALAKENVKFVKAIVDKTTQLQNLLRWIDNDDYKYELTHSMIICFLSSAIAQKYKFKNTNATENIALAAFFHDISLEAYQIENEPKFREALKQGIPINKTDVDTIRQHPLKSVEMLSNWKMCPSAVITIIENHCERPDGKGFPKGIIASEFDELSACFVFCEDLANFFLSNRSKTKVMEFLNNSNELYSKSPFRDFATIIKELLT